MKKLNLGVKIHELRKAQGLTQAGLAKKAQLSHATIVKIENGSVGDPKIGTLLKIVDALKVKIGDIVGG